MGNAADFQDPSCQLHDCQERLAEAGVKDIDVYSERRVRTIVKECVHCAADETGDDNFRYVSSHYLRRRFAQRLLVDHSMNFRIVMAVGGWDSFQIIEPYLNAPSSEVVNDAFEDAGLA